MKGTKSNILSGTLCASLIIALISSFSAYGQSKVCPSSQAKTYPKIRMTQFYFPQSQCQPDTIEICFMGDMMMHTKQIDNTRRPGSEHDFSTFVSLIEDDIRNADIAVGNMEYTLAGKPYTGYPSFSAPDGYETYLAECGFDIFLAANNHIFDKGARGAVRTLEKFRNLRETHKIQFTGLAGSEEELAETTPLLIACKGIGIAFINFTYGTNMACGKSWPQTNYESEKGKLAKAFETAKAQNANIIIALPHWGTEYVLNHSKAQETTAKWLIKNGADAIIGTHPHVIQDYQEIDGVPVAYSLGNAVSNMSATNTQLELMATIRIVKHNNGDIEMLPPTFKYLWCSLPGGYNNGYTVIPVEEFLGKRELWHGKWDYDKMVKTYNRIKR